MKPDSRMNILCFIMAAGASQRFGGVKQLAQLEKSQRSLLEHSHATHQGCKFYKVFAVLGANAHQIAMTLAPDVQSIHVQNWQLGLGRSISDALEHVDDQVSHVYIALADQVGISPNDCQLLIQKAKQHPECVIAASYNNKAGAPAIFPREYFAALQSLTGDKGARDVLKGLQLEAPNRIKLVELERAAIDIDTREQLAQFNKREDLPKMPQAYT